MPVLLVRAAALSFKLALSACSLALLGARGSCLAVGCKKVPTLSFRVARTLYSMQFKQEVLGVVGKSLTDPIDRVSAGDSSTQAMSPEVLDAPATTNVAAGRQAVP